MASENLVLDILIDGKGALDKVDAFVKKANKKLSKDVKFDPMGPQDFKRSTPEQLAKLNYNARKKMRQQEEKEQTARDKKVAALQKKLASDIAAKQKADAKEVDNYIKDLQRKHAAFVKRQQKEQETAEKASAKRVADTRRQLEERSAQAAQRRNQIRTNTAARNRLLDIRRQEIGAAQARGSRQQFADNRNFLMNANRGGARGRGTVKGSKTSGRMMNNIFQGQQIIEDFSFAGFRGASNNLALLASQISGPAGIIALVGLAGVTVAQMSGAFDKWGESAERAAKRAKDAMKGAFSEIERRNQFKMEYAGEKITPTGFEDLKEKARKSGKQVSIRKSSIAGLRDAEQIALRIAQLQEEIVGEEAAMSAEGFFPVDHKNREAALAKKRLQREMEVMDFRAKAPIIDPGVTDEQIYKNIEDFQSQIKDEIVKQNQELTTQTLAHRDNTGELRRQKDEAERLTKHYEKINSLEDIGAIAARSVLTLHEKDTANIQRQMELVKERYALDEDAFRKEKISEREFNNRRGDAIQHLERQQEQLKEIEDHEKSLGEVKKRNDEFVKRNLDEFNRQRKEEIDLRRTAASEGISAAKQELSISKRLSAEKDRQIKTELDGIKRLQDQQRDSSHSYGGRRFDIVRSQGANFFNQRVEAQVNNRARMARQMYGNDIPPEALDRMIEADANAFRKRAEARLKQRDNRMLEKRGQYLMNQSKAAGTAGDFEQQRKMLQELQQLQLSVASSDDNFGRAQGALHAADRTQKLISESFQQQQAAAQQNVNKFQAVKVQADALSTTIDNLIQKNNKIDPISDGAQAKINNLLQAALRLKGALGGLGADVSGVHPPPLKKKRGGTVPGSGSGDIVPAMLEPKEYVIKKDMVKKYGTGFFDSINAGRYASGGSVYSGRSNAAKDYHRWQNVGRYERESWRDRVQERLAAAKANASGGGRTNAAANYHRWQNVGRHKAQEFQARAQERLARVKAERAQKQAARANKAAANISKPSGGSGWRGLLNNHMNKAADISYDREMAGRRSKRQQRAAGRAMARKDRIAGGGIGSVFDGGPQGIPSMDPSLGFAGSGAAIDINLVNQITPQMQAFHDNQFAQQRANLLKGKYPITPMGKDLRNPGSLAFTSRSTLSRFGGGIQGLPGGRLFGDDRLVQERTRPREEYLRAIRLRAEQQRAAILAQKQQRSQVKNPFATGSFQEGGLVGGSSVSNNFTPGAINVNVNSSLQLEQVMASLHRLDKSQMKRHG